MMKRPGFFIFYILNLRTRNIEVGRPSVAAIPRLAQRPALLLVGHSLFDIRYSKKQFRHANLRRLGYLDCTDLVFRNS